MAVVVYACIVMICFWMCVNYVPLLLTRKNTSPIRPIMCLVGRETLLNSSLNYVQITTDYSDSKKCSECFALQQFNAGDEVFASCLLLN